MAIVINGSGTVTGLAVGGLPDGTVDDGTVASGIASSKLTGALPAISGASLTGFTDAQMPAGSVLQVVSTTKTDTFSFNQSGGWVTLTGMSITLPAIQSGSKILVSGVVHFGAVPDTNPTGRIRDSIDGLVQLPSGSGQLEGHFGHSYLDTSGVVQYRLFPSPFNYMYTPSTTASRTISVEVTQGDTDNLTCYVNRSNHNGAYAWMSLGMSTITVMEIAG